MNPNSSSSTPTLADSVFLTAWTIAWLGALCLALFLLVVISGAI